MLLAGVFTVNRRKIALVTGASAGIGAAVSVALAKADYQVIGVARRLDKIRRLNEQLNDAATRIDARCVDIRGGGHRTFTGPRRIWHARCVSEQRWFFTMRVFLMERPMPGDICLS